MRRIVLPILMVLFLVIVLGLGLTWLSRTRDEANHQGCRNNLRMLSLLGMPSMEADRKTASVWPGTIVSSAPSPEDRLSWVPLALPTLHEPGLNPGDLAKSINARETWNAPANTTVGEKVLRTLICPGRIPDFVPGEPAPTMYVGIAGLGADAATLPRTEPLSPRIGAFAYDSPTPLELIAKHDGVSQTFLFGQTTHRLGPWIRGGYSTVRGLEDAPEILSAERGQFGGAFADGAYFSFCDGAVKFFRYATDPSILKQLATIKSEDSVP